MCSMYVQATPWVLAGVTDWRQTHLRTVRVGQEEVMREQYWHLLHQGGRVEEDRHA
jgi:hypothetical protein